mmetsp:Transcript_10770/g.40290  ORF Transcript_10770/g.40290 Transcript_10770/m.40290 type:complete len:1383 (+) Transcript_10770:126-4274(+)
MGCLIFDDEADYNVTAERIFVAGLLQIGTEQSPYQHKAIITYVGEKTNSSLVGHGNKMMVVLNGGVLELHGKPKGDRTWVHLAATAQSDDTTIYVDDESVLQWQVGDELVLASTDFDWKQAEELTITEAPIADTSTTPTRYAIKISPKLRYMHYGEKQFFTKNNGDQITLDERAEVGLLTRNILIRGDDKSDEDRFGCDNKFVHTAKRIRISNIEVTKCGKLGLIGKYPLHFHVPDPDPNFPGANRTGDYIKSVAVHHTYQRSLTIHGAHNVLIDKMVFYHHNGHGLFFEDGIEQQNIVTNCLGLGSQRIPDEFSTLRTERLSNADSQPATFWITHPNNYFEGNVAAGSDTNGFWLQLDRYSLGPSASPYVQPQIAKFGQIDNCVSHSNGDIGFNTWHDFRMCARPEEYSTCGSSENPYIEVKFNSLTSYKNRGFGYFGYVSTDVDFGDSVFADNNVGFTFNVVAGSSFTAENVVVVGESANIGNPDPWSCWNCRKCEDFTNPSSKYHRTIPKSWSRNEILEGIVFNRDGGYQTINNVAFFNFEDNCERAASSISVRNDDRAFTVPYNQFVQQVEFHNAKPLHLTFNDPVAVYAAGSKSDGYRSAVIVDENGVLTSGKTFGGVGARVIPNNPIMTDDSLCQYVSAWNAFICDKDTVFRYLVVESLAMSNDLGALNISTAHGGSALLEGFSFTTTWPATWTYRLNSIYSQNVQDYKIEYTGRIGTPDKVHVQYSQNTLAQPAGKTKFHLRYTVWGPLEIELKLENSEVVLLNAFNDTNSLASYDCQTNIVTFDMQQVADISVKDALSTPPEKNCITFDAKCTERENCHADTMQGKCVADNECVCRWGWMNQNCTDFHCFHLMNCQGNGICVGPNKCQCFPGFEGLKCEKFALFNLFDLVLSFGDIHVTTLDAKKHYVFNSIGEFYMLKSPQVSLQARLVECVPNSKTSCMKAIALRGDESASPSTASRIMFEAVGEEQIRIRINGQEISLTTADPIIPADAEEALKEIQYQFDPETGEKVQVSEEDVKIEASIAFERTKDGIIVTTSKEGGYTWHYVAFANSETRIRLRNDGMGFLSVAFSPGKAQKFEGTGVGGLYGNKDGVEDNDFMLRDGTVLTDPTSEQIHQTFGESWRVSQAETLFEYDSPDSYSTVNDLTFEPQIEVEASFKSESLKQQATDLCTNTLQLKDEFLQACLYDVAQTNDLKFAQAAAASSAISTCSSDEQQCKKLEESVSSTCTPWNVDACGGLSLGAILGIAGGSALFITVCCVLVMSVVCLCACLSFGVLTKQRSSPKTGGALDDSTTTKVGDFLDLRLSKSHGKSNPLRHSKGFDQEMQEMTKTREPLIFYNTEVDHSHIQGSNAKATPFNLHGVDFVSEPVEHLE